jgi:hypothetical protein
MGISFRACARVGLSLSIASGLAWAIGCVGGSAFLLGSPLRDGPFGSGTDGGTGTGGGGGTGVLGGGAGGVPLDPCDETLNRKFIRISMRNHNPDDFIHYFVGFIAFVNGDTYPNGAVCADDIELYTSFGYQQVPEGQLIAFGSYCIQGPALLYFHKNGQFRNAGSGNASLASAIAPAQGSGTPTFDNFFTSSGAQVPVPNVILFHNPGGSAGAPLRVSRGDPAPCAGGFVINPAGDCAEDSFYYVDDQDLPSGSAALGSGSSRRVPSEIQGSGCQCPTAIQVSQAEQALIPPTTAIRNRSCNGFARGGRIEYAFIRDDRNPPVPQLLWKVSDSSGSVIQDFDPSVDLP